MTEPYVKSVNRQVKRHLKKYVSFWHFFIIFLYGSSKYDNPHILYFNKVDKKLNALEKLIKKNDKKLNAIEELIKTNQKEVLQAIAMGVHSPQKVVVSNKTYVSRFLLIIVLLFL